jgi:hypothetical protein
MRLETIDDRFGEGEQRKNEIRDQGENLLTPARQAGLEALEREFNELLKARPR